MGSDNHYLVILPVNWKDNCFFRKQPFYLTVVQFKLNKATVAYFRCCTFFTLKNILGIILSNDID